MNSGEQSKNLSLSKDALQQKKLEYFGIISNFIQGKGKGKGIESYTGKRPYNIYLICSLIFIKHFISKVSRGNCKLRIRSFRS